VGFINVYAPNDSGARCELWTTLAIELPQADRWILLGDFNMVENRQDKSNACGRLLPMRERILFDALKEQLNITDFPRTRGGAQYTWDNGRMTNCRFMARLDRLYMFRDTLPDGRRPLALYTIHSDNVRSDHKPVEVDITFEATDGRARHWKMNSAWLDEAIPALKGVWQDRPLHAPFFAKLRSVIKYYKIFCKQKAAAFQTEEVQFRNQLTTASELLDTDPHDPDTQELYGRLAILVQELEARKLAGKRIRSRIRWKWRGDLISKEFFQAVRERPQSANITSLKDQQGQAIQDRLGIQRLVLEYYSNLFRALPESDASRDTSHRLLAAIPVVLTDGMSQTLLAPLSQQELRHALESMAKEKNPGPDGIIMEFYLKFWDEIGLEFTTMITNSILYNRLPPGMTKGLVVLLHKGAERDILSNYKPITLLNTSYKFFAKAIQLRIQAMMVDLISEDQSAFLPGRYILDNVLCQHELVEWAKESHQDLVLLKLDFRKAYESVSWSFLFEVMGRMGMLPAFIRMVRLLFMDASASICINGEIT
jgi:hypothetical protein